MGAAFARVTDRQLRIWVCQRLSPAQIASVLGCSTSQIEFRIRRLYQEAHERGKQAPPTQDEIRSRCAEIQASWSDDERRRRSGQRSQEVSATVVRESDLRRLGPGHL